MSILEFVLLWVRVDGPFWFGGVGCFPLLGLHFVRRGAMWCLGSGLPFISWVLLTLDYDPGVL